MFSFLANFEWSKVDLNNWQTYLGVVIILFAGLSFVKKIVKLGVILIIVAILLVIFGIIDTGTLETYLPKT